GCLLAGCFVFSSRRRHTRCYRDWSSDVCSSDLYLPFAAFAAAADLAGAVLVVTAHRKGLAPLRYFVAAGAGFMLAAAFVRMLPRSEERRVGKGGRSGWAAWAPAATGLRLLRRTK